MELTPRETYYVQHYDIVRSYKLKGPRKKYVGDKSKKTCRFCNRSYPEVTFKNEAHAFPEFIGNKYLISNEECNDCNDKFSMSHENHFANYLYFERAVFQIKGKKGIPTYKTDDNLTKVTTEKNRLIFKDHRNHKIVEFDEEKKGGKFHGVRAPYIPRAVYKCLAKMAISIMPENKLSLFKDTIKWINHTDYKKDIYGSEHLFIVMIAFTPGPNPYKDIAAILVQRKDDSFLSPFMIFGITFSNFLFQIFLPFTKKDKHLEEKIITVQTLPITKRDHPVFGKTIYQYVNLSSTEIIKNERTHIDFKIENLVEEPDEEPEK